MKAIVWVFLVLIMVAVFALANVIRWFEDMRK